MEKLPTAEELLKLKETFDINHPTVSISDAIEAMIEFAKLHIEAALKAASEKSTIIRDEEFYTISYIDKNSILNAYPLTNIQ